MSLMYDKNLFSTQLKKLRESRWKQYKNNQDKRNNPYEKYAYCKSQDTLSEKLNVERRTYGKWENGTTIPTIDKVADICNVLDCNIDYLLGAEELIGFTPSAIASHYSTINIDIINKAISDDNYRDFLNYFMHPDNCYALVNSTTLNAWKDFLANSEVDNLNDPLKALLSDIFQGYQAFTPLSQYDKTSLKEYLISALPDDKFSFAIKKMDECININTCLSANILDKLGIVTDNPQNYQILIDYLVNYCFDVLLTKEKIDIQKEKIGQLFVHMLEKYLEK